VTTLQEEDVLLKAMENELNELEARAEEFQHG
jgi:hypothetical protein